MGRHHSAPPIDRTEIGIFGSDALDLIRGLQESMQQISVRIDQTEDLVKNVVRAEVHSLLAEQTQFMQSHLHALSDKLDRALDLAASAPEDCQYADAQTQMPIKDDLDDTHKEQIVNGVLARVSVQAAVAALEEAGRCKRLLHPMASDASTAASDGHGMPTVIDSWSRHARPASSNKIPALNWLDAANANEAEKLEEEEEADDTASIASTVPCHFNELPQLDVSCADESAGPIRQWQSTPEGPSEGSDGEARSVSTSHETKEIEFAAMVDAISCRMLQRNLKPFEDREPVIAILRIMAQASGYTITNHAALMTESECEEMCAMLEVKWM